jgi:type I restriction enzyme, S subunit
LGIGTGSRGNIKKIMKCYETYKSSGLDWIERIPLTWRVDRIKDLAEIITGNTPPKDDPDNYYDGTIPWIKPDQLRGSVVYDSDEKLSDKGTSFARLVPKNAILVGCIGDVGNFAIAGRLLATNQQINSLVFGETIDKSFSRYLIEGLKDEHKKHSTLVVVPILNKNRQGQIYLTIPGKESQLNISAYLDKQCVAIDKVLEAKRKQLTVLEELRKSIIHKAVTKGLDDNVKMKDSGIEWIEKMPKKWKVGRLKAYADINKQSLGEETEPDFSFFYIDIGNVDYEKGYEKKELIEFSSAPSRARRKVERGDTIVSTVRTYLKAIAYIDESGEDIVVSTGFAVVSPRRPLLMDKFLNHFLRSHFVIEKISSLSTGVGYPAIDSTRLSCIPIIIPSKEEQATIVEYLDAQCKRILDLRGGITHQIEVLEKYRQSLIHECVTGKRRITEKDLKELANV